jgi:hypothetical protein
VQSKIKAAALMTATVLLTIYVLRRVPVIGPFVDTALRG